MTRRSLLWIVPAVALLTLVLPTVAFAEQLHATDPSSSTVPQGAVFTMTNDVNGNMVMAYVVGPSGTLAAAGSFSTHGRGTGASLADEGALALTKDHRWLLVVNAGSDTVSIFHVNPPGGTGPILSFVDQVMTHGTDPVSIAIHGRFVYLLNAGNSSIPGNIFGFYLADQGLLFPLIDSSRALSTNASVAPAQIAFDHAGAVLIVTEKNTSVLDSYTVGPRGYVTGPMVTASNGSTPYGFAFGRSDTLIVSDAGPGALSSYAVDRSGTVAVKSGTVVDGQTAACWVATADGGRYAFTSNAHSGSISTYEVRSSGKLTLLASVGAVTGAGNTDLAVGGMQGQYLFVLDTGAGEIQSFTIGSDGSLALNSVASGLPAAAEGLAAF